MPAALIAPALQTVFGLGQSIFSGRKKKENELETYVDSYKPNQSIMDYYNKALSNYDANPYNTTAYRQQANNINRNLVTGINASQSRRGALGTIGALVQGANDASGKAVANAELQQGKSLSQLGQATGMKAAEDRRKWDMKYNLLAQKAGQAATTQNMGFKNIFGGISNAASIFGGRNGTPSYTSIPENTYDYTGNRNQVYA